MAGSKIPIVDVSALSLENENFDFKNISPAGVVHLQNLGSHLTSALSQNGFVYIAGHGLDQELVQQALSTSLEFFQLDLKSKTKVVMGCEYQGWVGQGREQFQGEEESEAEAEKARESYNVRDISSGGKFPDQNCPALRSSLTRMASALHQLSLRLLACISIGIGQTPSLLPSLHQGILSQGTSEEIANCSNLRSLYYPALERRQCVEVNPPKVKTKLVRCGEHSDYGSITLLIQDREGGLEAKINRVWQSLPPLPGTIVINVGDMLESLSGGLLPATLHRVVVSNDKMVAARQSLAFFVQPDDHVQCGPLTGPSSAYPSITAREHLEKRVKEAFGSRL